MVLSSLLFSFRSLSNRLLSLDFCILSSNFDPGNSFLWGYLPALVEFISPTLHRECLAHFLLLFVFLLRYILALVSMFYFIVFSRPPFSSYSIYLHSPKINYSQYFPLFIFRKLESGFPKHTLLQDV